MFRKSAVVIAALSMLILGAVWAFADVVGLAASNVKQPAPQLITAGQPAEADFAELKSQGITRIINLRTEAETLPFDEQARAQALGIDYVSLPIAGAADLTRENAERLDALLAGDEVVFLHCASGNRVGALLALREYMLKGASVDEALAVGRAGGMTSLEGAVNAVLQEASATEASGDHAVQK